MGPDLNGIFEERGKLILIEGTDGSGKKTQAEMLFEKLNSNGFPSEIMSFPDYDSATGRIIGQCYLGKPDLGEGDIAWFGDADSLNPKVASLYYAADRLDKKEKMEQILNSGKHLILDRYVESNMGHQGGKAKTPEERDEIISHIDKLEYGLHKLPKPDLTIFLYMPFEHAEKLRKQRGEVPDGHESNVNHLMRAEKTYIDLAKKREWSRINCNYNGDLKTRGEISKIVYSRVLDLLKQ